MTRVSVVLIFLNEERFLESAVQSIRDQTLTDWELILVDDGSTDRSTQIARDLAAVDGRIRYVDHPGHQNRGMSASRNVGVQNSNAPYIAFMDGDDWSFPSKLAEQVDLLDRMPDVALVFGVLQYWHSWDPGAVTSDREALTGGVADCRLDPPESAIQLYPIDYGCPGAGPDPMIRRSAFEAVGGYEEQFRGMYEDQALYVKVFLRYPVYISSHMWLRYRQHDASCCAQMSETEYWRLRGLFLGWLHGWIRDRAPEPRVEEALRRARREVSYRRVTAPILDQLDRIRIRLPVELKDRLKRTLGRVGAT